MRIVVFYVQTFINLQRYLCRYTCLSRHVVMKSFYLKDSTFPVSAFDFDSDDTGLLPLIPTIYSFTRHSSNLKHAVPPLNDWAKIQCYTFGNYIAARRIDHRTATSSGLSTQDTDIVRENCKLLYLSYELEICSDHLSAVLVWLLHHWCFMGESPRTSMRLFHAQTQALSTGVNLFSRELIWVLWRIFKLQQ